MYSCCTSAFDIILSGRHALEHSDTLQKGLYCKGIALLFKAISLSKFEKHALYAALEMPRIELGASYMQSMRSTTELFPPNADNAHFRMQGLDDTNLPFYQAY